MVSRRFSQGCQFVFSQVVTTIFMKGSIFAPGRANHASSLYFRSFRASQKILSMHLLTSVCLVARRVAISAWLFPLHAQSRAISPSLLVTLARSNRRYETIISFFQDLKLRPCARLSVGRS